MTVFSLAVVMTCVFFLWSTNPVHGVLSLVVLGLSFAGLLLINSLEFLALLLVLVYVGAVTVLFIFVVMMVNLRASSVPYATAEAWPLWVTLMGLALTGLTWETPSSEVFLSLFLDEEHNLNSLGFFLYGTERLSSVLVVGLVLFVAMIAAICLSLVAGENYRTQEFYSQVRKPNAVFTLVTKSTLLVSPIYETDDSITILFLFMWLVIALLLLPYTLSAEFPAGTPSGAGAANDDPSSNSGGEPPDKWWWVRYALIAAGVVALAAAAYYLAPDNALKPEVLSTVSRVNWVTIWECGGLDNFIKYSVASVKVEPIFWDHVFTVYPPGSNDGYFALVTVMTSYNMELFAMLYSVQLEELVIAGIGMTDDEFKVHFVRGLTPLLDGYVDSLIAE